MVQTSPKSADEMSALVAAVFQGIEYSTETAADELVVIVKPEDVATAAKLAKEDKNLQMDYLRCLSGMDLGDQLQVVYHLHSTSQRHKMVLKANLAPDRPVVPTVINIWLGADWHEREAGELFGIQFRGHPDPRRLLLAEDLAGFPMLKSFTLPKRGRQENVDLGPSPACPSDEGVIS